MSLSRLVSMLDTLVNEDREVEKYFNIHGKITKTFIPQSYIHRFVEKSVMGRNYAYRMIIRPRFIQLDFSGNKAQLDFLTYLIEQAIA